MYYITCIITKNLFYLYHITKKKILGFIRPEKISFKLEKFDEKGKLVEYIYFYDLDLTKKEKPYSKVSMLHDYVLSVVDITRE